jgi:hypothetical protein
MPAMEIRTMMKDQNPAVGNFCRNIKKRFSELFCRGDEDDHV